MNLPFNDSMIFISWPSRVHRVNQTTLFTLREVGIRFRLARDGCVRFDIRLIFVSMYLHLCGHTSISELILHQKSLYLCFDIALICVQVYCVEKSLSWIILAKKSSLESFRKTETTTFSSSNCALVHFNFWKIIDNPLSGHGMKKRGSGLNR